jgi:16S rRNA (guanine966-N2)-methyltransferase
VREAIFDVLGSLADLEGMVVADLFAGSGAMGIEALSRGAATAVFVDDAPAAVQAVQDNLASLELASQGRVVKRDVVLFLERPQHFDLALCDPPYDYGGWGELLARLDAGLVVLESGRSVDVPATWETVRNKRYGGTLVTVARSLGAPQKGSS